MKVLRPWALMLAALAVLGSPSAGRAGRPCLTLPDGVTVDRVTVSIAAIGARRPHQAAIRGVLRIPPGLAVPALRGITPPALCRAAVGAIAVDDTLLCATFGDGFGGLDRIERAGPRLAFEIHSDVPRRPASDAVDIAILASPDRCAPQATFLVAGRGDRELARVPFLADRLAAGGTYWTETQWTPRNLRIGIRERRANAAQSEDEADQPTLSQPRSWRSDAQGEIVDRLQDFLWVFVWVVVILAGFMSFGGALLYAEAKPPLAAVVKALTAAVALYAAARWVGGALEFGRLLYNARVGGEDDWAERTIRLVALGLPYGPGRIVAATALMTPLTLLLWTASLIAGAPRAGVTLFRNGTRLILRALAIGSALAWLFLAVAAGAAAIIPRDAPFEPVALAVSLFLAGWAVAAFGPVTGFDRGRAALAAAAFTLLLLYPHPVIQSSGAPPSAIDNALAWFPYAGGSFVPNAMLLTVALVAALKLVRSRGPDTETQTIASHRTMLFLFGFSVTLSSIRSLTSAILLFAVLIAADRLLFPLDTAADPGKKPAPAAKRRGGRETADPKPREISPPRLALGVAVIAAAVFWLQYSGDLLNGRQGPPGLLLPAMLIYAAAVPAAIGGLFLQHSFERLPGPIAAAKALVITAFAFAASAATRLPLILAERSILPAVIDVLGIFTALIATAILLYDGPQARDKLGGNTLKERLAGSGFGWFLTVASSVALAAASALSPIVFGELGNVFRSVVHDTLGSARAGGGQAGPATPPR